MIRTDLEKHYKIIFKKFDKDVLQHASEIKTEYFDVNKVGAVNNIALLIQKIKNLNRLNTEDKFNFVETGTFTGKTLVPAHMFWKKQDSLNLDFYGIDTFQGFPSQVVKNKNDKLEAFFHLFKRQSISKDHYEKSQERLSNIQDDIHLKQSYFSDDKNEGKFESLFEYERKNSNFNLIKSSFSETEFKDKIDILHIDSDLYDSYRTVLNKFYNLLSPESCIIFDEYYSLKYPGARIAVDEYFSNNRSKIKGHFEVYKTSEGFERWCFCKTNKGKQQ